ncbi:MAG: carbonic anhydrase [Pseudomonadota bacterium]
MRTFPLQLMRGFKSFRGAKAKAGSYQHSRLAIDGQKPEVLVIACCDSRVTPELIFSADPGSLFVVRNVANLVPPPTHDDRNLSTAAAIEFAVTGLHVRHIVVLGHARCGGIKAAVDNVDGQKSTSAVSRWMNWLPKTVHDDAHNHAHDHDFHDDGEVLTRCSHDHKYRAVEEAGIRQSVNNLMLYDYVREGVEFGKLTLHGSWFDIEKGELWVMDGLTKVFHWTDGVDFK